MKLFPPNVRFDFISMNLLQLIDVHVWEHFMNMSLELYNFIFCDRISKLNWIVVLTMTYTGRDQVPLAW